MALPQTNGAKKPRRSPKALGGMAFFFEDTRMEATFRQTDKGMRLDATGRKGSKEVFSVHLDHLEDLMEGLSAAFTQPAMLALLPILQEQLAGAVAHARTAPPHYPEPTERDKAGWKAAEEARASTLDAWAKEQYGAESWRALVDAPFDEASSSAESARQEALAEYDAAHGVAEA